MGWSYLTFLVAHPEMADFIPISCWMCSAIVCHRMPMSTKECSHLMPYCRPQSLPSPCPSVLRRKPCWHWKAGDPWCLKHVVIWCYLSWVQLGDLTCSQKLFIANVHECVEQSNLRTLSSVCVWFGESVWLLAGWIHPWIKISWSSRPC